MIAEKPSWIRHEGLQIFSIDVQPGGLRFATGGADHKVKIWDMNSVARDFDKNDQSHRILATLRDHFGSVNCVRWAKHGRKIASGSGDKLILIHEMKPGSGTSEFGSGEPFDVENWKVVMTLRGHTTDVMDLNWSPDDSMLASGSLDNTIHIWNMSNGICIAVLRGHSSFVKGVTWDPIGSFLASQSDDKTVIIWRTADWSIAHKTDVHLAKSLGPTFFMRLDWSPCGCFLTTTHGFQNPKHSAPALERDKWAAYFDFLGHRAPVVVVKFNHSMFKRHFSNAQDVRASSPGQAKGSTKTGGTELWPYNVIAIGSQDRTITVWTTAAPRPLFVAKHFFTKSVVDLSWSPDGYSLFACSLDGSVSTFHFEVKEIGQRLTDDELDELNRNRYGDVWSQQANLAAKQKTSRGRKKIEVRSDVSNKVAASVRVSRSAKQKEYRRPDYRKRIENAVSHSQTSDLPLISSEGNKVDDIPKVGKTLEAGSDVKEHSGVTTKACFSDSLVIERVGAASGSAKLLSSLAASNATLAIRVVDRKEDAVALPITLEARPREQAVNDIVGASNTSLVKETEIICRRGSQTLWFDRISGKASILAGNANFWAVGFEDSCLQVYTKCGRRAMPTMMMGSAALFLECDECWKLLLITKKGSLYLWDLFSRNCLLHDTLASLFAADPMASLKNAGTIKIISAKVSKSGSPLVVLATRHAFLYDMSLKCWLRVADDCFPASNFASSWNMGSSQCGELSTLQADVRKFLARKPVWSRVADDGMQTRSQLEAQLASALTLKSTNEYRQCLVSYVRHLAREADESRLREVCESFLGPPTGMGAASSNPNIEWDPCVLGLKKHELLRDDILPAVASNRKVQRLLNEFMDRLSEYGSVETQSEQNNSTIPMTLKQAQIKYTK